MPDPEIVVEGNPGEDAPESEDTTEVNSTEETLAEVDETAQEQDISDEEAERKETQSIKDKGWDLAKKKDVEVAEAKAEAKVYKEQLDAITNQPTAKPDQSLSPAQARIKELNAAMLQDDELANVAADLKAKVDAEEMSNADAVKEWSRERRVFAASRDARVAQNLSHSSAASAEMSKIMSDVPDTERDSVRTALNELGLDIDDPASYADADPKYIKKLVGHITNSVRLSSGGSPNAPPLKKPPKVMSASGGTATPGEDIVDPNENFAEFASRLAEKAGLT